MSFQSQLEAAVKERFRISACEGLRSALSDSSKKEYDAIEANVGKSTMKFFEYSLIRNSFLIELVNRDITSTKFQVRWTPELKNNDPRWSSYAECLSIAEKLIAQLAALPKDDQKELGTFEYYETIPYELPIDYKNRWATRLHSRENVDLVYGEKARKALALRVALEDEEFNPDARVFKAILKDKIEIKTYLTDRAQTGAYQTNREKRWETHPNSVQFAKRLDCMEIESKLLLEVATFKGANPVLVSNLQARHFLPLEFIFARCPITGEYLEYKDFVNDVLNPSHGRSAFQVGHLNPLKTGTKGEIFGHVANNISWISDDGNRIQGSLSMDEVDELLIRIYINRDFASKVDAYKAKLEERSYSEDNYR